MGIALELTQGTARDFPFQVANPDGTTPTGIFLSTDVLTASVWAGSNETPLLTPVVTWISATNAQYQVSFQNTDSASLAIGEYYLQAYATRAGTPTRTTALLPRGTSLRVLAAPGATFTARPTYIAITDVRNIAPWIDDLQVPDSNMGFDNQLADAHDWLDEMTLRNYRGGNVSLLGYHGFALDAWYTGGGRRTSLTNRWLYAALQANQLLVKPRVVQVCAVLRLEPDLREHDHEGRHVRDARRALPARGREPAGFDDGRDRCEWGWVWGSPHQFLINEYVVGVKPSRAVEMCRCGSCPA